jgi:translin
MDKLESGAEDIRERFEAKSKARDAAINRSRGVIQHCSRAIRAMHRQEWDVAEERLGKARAAVDEMVGDVQEYPDLLYAGYTQDAVKEYVEAVMTDALLRDKELPTVDELGVHDDTYLNGLCEAASELRRSILDRIRAEGHTAEAEDFLDKMQTVYDMLSTFDFHDAITGGLRRRVDQLRGVLERTRGDMTTAFRQLQLQEALEEFSRRIENAQEAETA